MTEGPHEGRTFEFRDHDTFIVGRSKDAHFRLPFKDKYFLRNHFLLEINPPRCRLVDMASTNGTYVNGERVHVPDLRDGDRIKGGRTVIQVAIRAAPTSEPAIESVPAPTATARMRPPDRAASPAGPLPDVP